MKSIFFMVVGLSVFWTASIHGELILSSSFDEDSETPHLIYDPVSGNVVIDPQGNEIISFTLKNSLGETGFNAGNFSDADFPPNGLFDVNSGQLGWFSGSLGSGIDSSADLGDVFPMGFNQPELDAYLAENIFARPIVGGQGGGGGEFELVATVVTWQNPDNQFDVNADGAVAPNDVFLVAHRIVFQGAGALPTPSVTDTPPPFVDVSGDNFLSAVDVFLVSGFIVDSRQASVSAAIAVPEPATITIMMSSVIVMCLCGTGRKPR